jgi:hypothetical protein
MAGHGLATSELLSSTDSLSVQQMVMYYSTTPSSWCKRSSRQPSYLAEAETGGVKGTDGMGRKNSDGSRLLPGGIQIRVCV